MNWKDIVNAENKLKLCPFCGKEFHIFISDEEGNDRDMEYLKDPWSGLRFNVYHYNYECPLYRETDMSPLCSDNDLDELVKFMNQRNENN